MHQYFVWNVPLGVRASHYRRSGSMSATVDAFIQCPQHTEMDNLLHQQPSWKWWIPMAPHVSAQQYNLITLAAPTISNKGDSEQAATFLGCHFYDFNTLKFKIFENVHEIAVPVVNSSVCLRKLFPTTYNVLHDHACLVWYTVCFHMHPWTFYIDRLRSLKTNGDLSTELVMVACF